ncbi:MAG: hypothetical protein LBQ58_00930 [Synergistaceae bacterium]|jgi:hypothetical protein|nr:hypothetical protein [Synergistaceae bacterium]
MKFFRRVAAAMLLLTLFVPQAALACECEEPVIIDGLEAYDRSLRKGRDDVEGFWGIYLDWQPEKGANRSYRMAIVKNTYDVYPEADYIGVVTCNIPGCTRGEVKLLLTRTDKRNEFESTLLVSDVDGAKGIAILTDDAENGRKNSVLDMRDMKYRGHVMAEWMVRIKNG